MTMTINIRGQLMDLSTPKVMGIINLTPDSFYSQSRKQTEQEIEQRALQIVSEGAAFIDVGAYSSRPGAEDISEQEEMERLRHGLPIINHAAPNTPVSIDTFRPNVAKMCVQEYGADIINDISGACQPQETDSTNKKNGPDDSDDAWLKDVGDMFQTVADLHVPYILMHMKGNPRTMQNNPHYDDLMGEIMLYFSKRINRLHALGVNDIILDPGFGFAKTLEQNYQLLHNMEELHEFHLPLLVGISRKSMIFRLLDTTPQEALNGTTALNTIALMKGASILRVHDVKECVEAVKIYNQMNKNGQV